MTQKYNVTGMSCAACSARIEKVVGKLEGVHTVTVNLLMNNMTVDFDDNLLNHDRYDYIYKPYEYLSLHTHKVPNGIPALLHR